MYNEPVKVKRDFGNWKKDQEGIATAYLPDMKKFAVYFGERNWITFEWTEEEFLDHFEMVDKCLKT